MSAETKKAKQCEASRKYRLAHKEKIRQYMLNYRSRPEYKEAKRKHDKTYTTTHKDDLLLKRKEYREKNKERINQKLRDYQRSDIGEIKYREYRELNKEQVRKWNRDFYHNNHEKRTEANNKWKEKNKERVKIYYLNNKIRRKKLCGGGGSVRADVIISLLEQQNNKCFYCNEILIKYHIDHYIPLSRGGEHKEHNLRLACPSCNLRKGAKMPEDFIKELNKQLKQAM